MGDLSKNFDRAEFACHGDNCCGKSAPVCDELIDAIQQLRDIAGPLIVDCGFRCNVHNAVISHAANSQHPLGTAADVRSETKKPDELADLAETIGSFNRGGIGVYSNFIHVDVRRSGRARWTENND
jgi:uncharacterized protein YcbK (DUF882 family)